MSIEEKVSSLIVEQRNINRIMETLYNEILTLQSSIEDRQKALTFIEKYIGFSEDLEILFPLGGGLYINASIKPGEKIYRSVGSGVYLVDEPSKIADIIKKNIEDLSKALEERRNLLEQYRARYDEIAAELSELYFKLQNTKKVK